MDPLIWITKTLTGGDTNTRLGIAEHIGGQIHDFEVPNEFCVDEDIINRLAQAGLIENDKHIWPDVLIGPSLHIPYMQEIKRMSNGKTVVVALRTPVRDIPIQATQQQIFDTDIIVSYPYHNNIGISNLYTCNSLPNRVTAEKLAEAKARWNKKLLARYGGGPIICVLIGGDIGDKRRVFSDAIAAKFIEMISGLATNMGGYLLISMSARTPGGVKKIVRSIKAPNFLYDPESSSGNNPYFGMLANADYIIVTADSASMCNEAVSSGKPVYIFYDESFLEEIHSKIVSNLVANGYARFLSNQREIEPYSYTPVNSAKNVAQLVINNLQKRKK